MDYRKSHVLMQAGGITGLLMMGAAFLAGVGWLAAVGTAVGLAAIIQAWFFFRCPHCGGAWDIRGGVPHYCPHCGEYIW